MASTITDIRTASASILTMGFIRRYAVTPVNLHDRQMLPRLLDPANEHDYVQSDSAYSGEFFED